MVRKWKWYMLTDRWVIMSEKGGAMAAAPDVLSTGRSPPSFPPVWLYSKPCNQRQNRHPRDFASVPSRLESRPHRDPGRELTTLDCRTVCIGGLI